MINAMVVTVLRIVNMIYLLYFAVSIQSLNGLTIQPCQGEKCVEHTTSPPPSCLEGYYGPNCIYKCSDRCIGGQCAISNTGVGVCTVGCIQGYWGVNCRSECASVCDGCNRETGVCIACKLSAKCEENCFEMCPSSYCKCASISQEPCLFRKFGSKCQWGCPEFCQDNVCNRQSGLCVSGCKKGYFGSKCENRCNINCRQGKCNLDGNCSWGCNPGFYGDFCELVCSENCRLHACDRHVGDCTSGCADGYFGPRCNRTCPGCEVCDGRTGDCLGAGEGTKRASHLILISAFASVTFILLVAVFVLLYRSRSRIYSRQQYLTAVTPLTLPISVNSTYNEAYDVINEQAKVLEHTETSSPNLDEAFMTHPAQNKNQKRAIDNQEEVLGHLSSSTPTNLGENNEADQAPSPNQNRAIFRTL